MSKVLIELHVTVRAITEALPVAKSRTEVKHNYEHPDALIVIYRHDGARLAGRADQIRHAVMVALQSAGLSVSALRDTGGGERKQKSHKVSAKQKPLL